MGDCRGVGYTGTPRGRLGLFAESGYQRKYVRVGPRLSTGAATTCDIIVTSTPGLVTLTGPRQAGQAWAVVRRVPREFRSGNCSGTCRPDGSADGSGAAHWRYTAAVTEDAPRMLTIWAAGSFL